MRSSREETDPAWMDQNPNGRFFLLLRSFKMKSREAAPKTNLRLEYTVLLVALFLLAVFVGLVLHALAS